MPMKQMRCSHGADGGAGHMYVHLIPLEKRPQGSGIGGDMDASSAGAVVPGCTVALQYREIRINVQVLETEADLFFVGQVLAFDGTLEPEIQGVNIGSFLRFREQHIFSCHNN